MSLKSDSHLKQRSLGLYDDHDVYALLRKNPFITFGGMYVLQAIFTSLFISLSRADRFYNKPPVKVK